MSVTTKRVIGRCVIFALLGLLSEVFFTAGIRLAHGNWNMHGCSSPWMMVDYGLLGILLMPMARPLIRRGVPLPLRAVVYMVAIFAVELVSGWIFDLCGLAIWDYSSLPYNLFGYITALYIPCWYGAGLVVEYLYRKVDACALVLALGWHAARLEALATGASGTE